MERDIWVRNFLLGFVSKGEKTLEIRPNSHPFSIFKEGDTLNFNDKFKKRILNIRTYDNILLLIEQEDADKILPLHSAGTILEELKKVYSLDKLLGPWIVFEM